MFEIKEKYDINDLREIMKELRSEHGCPWDKVQTHKSIRMDVLEEAYEAVDAIDENNLSHLKEELGDVLLQVLLHSQIASEEGAFNIDDVAKELKDKLIHRHPHVFGNAHITTAEDVKKEWDKLKAEEKTERKSAMDGLSKSQAALIAAQKISLNGIVRIHCTIVLCPNLKSLSRQLWKKIKITWKMNLEIFFLQR